jgi:hypothetical protein
MIDLKLVALILHLVQFVGLVGVLFGLFKLKREFDD